MGKTYKTQPDDFYSDNFSDYDYEEFDVDDKIDSLRLDVSAKHRKYKRGQHQQTEKQLYNLPADWFETAPAAKAHRDDWQ